MNELKKTRLSHNLTQKEAALILGISSRTYQRYEEKQDDKKSEMFIDRINKEFRIDEENGILSINSIKELLLPILKEFNISICYLFGSYARGEARPTSDVDLLMNIENVDGLKYFSFVERLRSTLNKKVDLITTSQLTSSKEMMEVILKEGIKINDWWKK